MPVEWAGLSPQLLLTVDRDSGDRLCAQLERQLRDAIRSGRLQAGERLPSSRELARVLGLSRGLVQDCYAQLQAEGYLVTRVGSATRVAACAQIAPTPAAPPPDARPRLIADFRHGVPDLASFPLADWLWLPLTPFAFQLVTTTKRWCPGGTLTGTVSLALGPFLLMKSSNPEQA